MTTERKQSCESELIDIAEAGERRPAARKPTKAK